MAQRLEEDLNIIQRSGIEIQVDSLTKDLDIIQKLDDEPNDVGGLSAAELKAKFDEAGNTIKDFINESLIPQVVGADATEAVRKANEAQREANEAAREAAETERTAAEVQRQAGEAAREAAETARETAFTAAQAERAAEFDEAQASRAAVFSAGEEARNFWDDYDPTKVYVPGNKVYYLGSSYVNRAACVNVLPTVKANWQMIAKKGADSDEGLSQEEADLRYLQLAGGVLTGAVKVLSPTENANPATKQYTDTGDAGTLSSAKTYADSKTAAYAYSKQQSLKAATAAAYGLTSDAVPDDVLAKARELIAAAKNSADSRGRIAVGTYKGTGAEIQLNAGFAPQAFIIYTIYYQLASDNTYWYLSVGVKGTNINAGIAGQSSWSNGSAVQALSAFVPTWKDTGVAYKAMNTSGINYGYILFG